MYLIRYSFPDFCYLGFAIDPDGIHKSTPALQCAWAHPEVFHVLFNHPEKSHRSGLIKWKFIFAFNHFSVSTSPTPQPCTTEGTGKGWFETRALFPGGQLTHSTPSEGRWTAEAATDHLCSGTYSHVRVPSLLQKHRKTSSQPTLRWWFSRGMLCRSWGGRGALAQQWVMKPQLASGVDRPLLLMRTAPRTSGWHAEHSPRLCPVFLRVLGQRSLSHLPICKRGAWHHFLSSFPACFLCLPRGPVLPLAHTAPGAVWHWWGHCWNGEGDCWLQPQCFNLTGPHFPGSDSPKILYFAVPVSSMDRSGASVALFQIQHRSQAKRLWQAQPNASQALLSGRSWQRTVWL